MLHVVRNRLGALQFRAFGKLAELGVVEVRIVRQRYVGGPSGRDPFGELVACDEAHVVPALNETPCDR